MKVARLVAAARVMAEATSYFVQEDYAVEGLAALEANGWRIVPPAGDERGPSSVSFQGDGPACPTGSTGHSEPEGGPAPALFEQLRQGYQLDEIGPEL